MHRIDLPLRNWIAGLGLSCVFALPAIGGPAQDGVPSAFQKARYEALRAHSPFSLATEAPPAPAPQASFAANWFVSGIGRIGDDDFVSIKSRDKSKEFSLYGRASDDPSAVALVSINWSDEIGKSTVILRKGTETARLEFNEAELRAVPPPPPNTPPAARTPLPGQPPPNFAAANAPGAGNVKPMPSASAPPPIRRRMVPIQPPR